MSIQTLGYSSQQQPNIHPDQLEGVEQLRETLGVDEVHHHQNGHLHPTAPPYNQDFNCPICFGPAQFAVQTNCGHLYCCNCIIQYWRHTCSIYQAVSCPVCRTQVAVLLPAFAEADPLEPGRDQATANIHEYNRRFSGQRRPLMDHIRDLPVLLPYLLRQLFSFTGLMWMFRLRVFLCLFGLVIYILSPLDIIPEAVFGLFGLFDDLFIAFVLLLYITIALGQFMANQPGVPN